MGAAGRAHSAILLLAFAALLCALTLPVTTADGCIKHSVTLGKDINLIQLRDDCEKCVKGYRRWRQLSRRECTFDLDTGACRRSQDITVPTVPVLVGGAPAVSQYALNFSRKDQLAKASSHCATSDQWRRRRLGEQTLGVFRWDQAEIAAECRYSATLRQRFCRDMHEHLHLEIEGFGECQPEMADPTICPSRTVDVYDNKLDFVMNFTCPWSGDALRLERFMLPKSEELLANLFFDTTAKQVWLPGLIMNGKDQLKYKNDFLARVRGVNFIGRWTGGMSYPPTIGFTFTGTNISTPSGIGDVTWALQAYNEGAPIDGKVRVGLLVNLPLLMGGVCEFALTPPEPARALAAL